MRKSLLKALVAAAVFAASSGVASAGVIYTYTGNAYTEFFQNSTTAYSAGSKITGWIELASALGSSLSGLSLTPISFSFFDGLNTYTQTNSTNASLLFDQFSTDASGNIVNWNVRIHDQSDWGPGGTDAAIDFRNLLGSIFDQAQFYNCSSLSAPNQCNNILPAFGGSFSQGISRTAGLWTSPPRVESVPEPSALAVIGAVLLSLFGFGMMRRRTEA